MVSQLTAMSAQLSMKREKIAHQLGSLQLRREHVKAARRAIERETTVSTAALAQSVRTRDDTELPFVTDRHGGHLASPTVCRGLQALLAAA